jgi:hypothetical protein
LKGLGIKEEHLSILAVRVDGEVSELVKAGQVVITLLVDAEELREGLGGPDVQ